jgi:hypothetical protein
MERKGYLKEKMDENINSYITNQAGGHHVSLNPDSGQVRIRTWQEFKQTVREKKPQSIVYILEQNGFAANKEVTILRIIMLHERQYYIFIDSPKADQLRETGIPLHKDNTGTRYLEDQEVKDYLKGEFADMKLEIYSFWTT